jgi:large subunit ribosomal protein L23
MINYGILKSPVMTEKSNLLMENENRYVFVVSNNATKGQIKEAVEGLYKVKVIDVKTVRNPGRIKRSLSKRNKTYKSTDTKKAIVQLEPKNTIKLYEGGTK